MVKLKLWFREQCSRAQQVVSHDGDDDDVRRLISKSDNLIIIDNDIPEEPAETAVVTAEPTSLKPLGLSLTRKHISSSPYRVIWPTILQN